MIGWRWPVRALALVAAVVLLLGLQVHGVLVPPDLVLLVVVAAALTDGPAGGAVTGLAGGWLLDLAPPGGTPFGLTALCLAAAGGLIGLARRRSGHPWWWPVPAAAAAFVVSRAAPLLIALGSGGRVDGASLAWQLVTTATFALVVVPALTRLDAGLVRRGWA